MTATSDAAERAELVALAALAVAQADGRITDDESAVLESFALLLDVAGVPEQLLTSLNAGLD